jgi:hypothetical protein
MRESNPRGKFCRPAPKPLGQLSMLVLHLGIDPSHYILIRNASSPVE